MSDPTPSTHSNKPPANATGPTLTPRGYQLELFNRAYQQNVIACLETGAGKTFIAALLIDATLNDINNPPPAPTREQSPLSIRAPFPSSPQDSPASTIPQFSPTTPDPLPRRPHAVFVAHRVSLVEQQARALADALPAHSVRPFFGPRSPKRELHPTLPDADVLVMTAQIMLNLLMHAHLDLSTLSLLVLDEAHNATRNHPYARIFRDFYHTLPADAPHPRVFAVTATPVKRKADVRQHIRCVRAISELEATLDATIVTVSRTSQVEVDIRVPKPHEYVLFYRNCRPPGGATEPTSTTSAATSATQSESDLELEFDLGSESDGDDEEVDEEHLISFLRKCTASATLELASAQATTEGATGTLVSREVQIIARMHRSLGFTPAASAARLFCGQRGMCPEKMIATLLENSPQAHLEGGGLRDKAVKLLDLLCTEYHYNCARVAAEGVCERKDSFRAIVFVKERVFALLLSLLINTAFKELDVAELRSRPVVGAQSDKCMRMSRSDMLSAVDEFRRGEFGVLVASNVIEEGIDVPACGLVVAFDALLSSTAYVQARGRARRRDAHYVAFVDEHDPGEWKALCDAKRGAEVMNDTAKGAFVSEKVRAAVREEVFAKLFSDERMLFSRTTNARIGESEAVGLLQRYCTFVGIRKGVREVEDLTFTVLHFDQMFTAEVALDERLGVNVRGVCRIPQLREAQAKRVAALDAYERLYRMGEVDEHLLPKQNENKKIES